MGVPIVPLIGLGLQAGGLVASIMGQNEQQKELERQARQRASSAAWTNLISVAGGGGPVAVPDPTTGTATGTLSQIGQAASGLGNLVGQYAAISDKTEADAIQRMSNLASLGIKTTDSNVPEDVSEGLTKYATEASEIKNLNKQKLTAEIDQIGKLTPAQKSQENWRMATGGVLPKDAVAPAGFHEMSKIAQGNRALTQANSGLYKANPENPNNETLLKLNNMAENTRYTEELKPWIELRNVGALTKSTDTGDVSLPDSFYEYSDLVNEELSASVTNLKAKVGKALNPQNITQMKQTDLLAFTKSMTKLLEGEDVDPVMAAVISGLGGENAPAILKSMQKGSTLDEGMKEQVMALQKAGFEELARRARPSGAEGADATDPHGLFTGMGLTPVEVPEGRDPFGSTGVR